jgi:hypothetical protein
MYGLLYPTILGAVGVETLIKLEDAKLDPRVLPVAITVGAFFTVSFGSAYELDKEYRPGPFVLDVVEVLEIWACFILLGIIAPPDMLAQRVTIPTVTITYWVLVGVLASQVLWRQLMDLKAFAFLDLKGLFLGLAVLGATRGEHHDLTNWVITGVFSLAAVAYVASHPYDKKDKPPYFWIGRFWAR